MGRAFCAFLALAVPYSFPEAGLAADGFNINYIKSRFNGYYLFSETPRSFEDTPSRYLLRYAFLKNPVVEILDGSFSAIVEQVHTLSLGSQHRILPSTDAGWEATVASAHLPQRTAKALADSRFFANISLPRLAPNIHLSLLPELFLPTGAKESFLGNGQSGVGISFAGLYDLPGFDVVGNLAYESKPGAKYQELNYEQTLYASGGISAPLDESLAFVGEGFALMPQGSPGVGEVYLGFSKRVGSGRATGGVAMASLGEEHSREFRLLASYVWSPSPGESTAAPPKRLPPKPQCRVGERQMTIHARRLSAAEKETLVLPYRTSGQKAVIPMIDLGSMTEMIEGTSRVRDRQVLFAFDLPRNPHLERVQSAELRLRLIKYSRDGKADTEFLCLVRERICSGKLFESQIDAYRDDRFFDRPTGMGENTYFVDQLKRARVASQSGAEVFGESAILDLGQLLHGSGVGIDQLVAPSREAPLSLYVVVADDVFVDTDARLVIAHSEKVCR